MSEAGEHERLSSIPWELEQWHILKGSYCWMWFFFLSSFFLMAHCFLRRAPLGLFVNGFGSVKLEHGWGRHDGVKIKFWPRPCCFFLLNRFKSVDVQRGRTLDTAGRTWTCNYGQMISATTLRKKNVSLSVHDHKRVTDYLHVTRCFYCHTHF